MKFSALNVVFTSLNFISSCIQWIFRMGASNLVPPSKYSHSATQMAAAVRDGDAIWSMWMHRTQCQLLGSVSLDFVHSGTLNMHCCRTFPSALATLSCVFCYFFVMWFHQKFNQFINLSGSLLHIVSFRLIHRSVHDAAVMLCGYVIVGRSITSWLRSAWHRLFCTKLESTPTSDTPNVFLLMSNLC